jgi:hypothetical protein
MRIVCGIAVACSSPGILNRKHMNFCIQCAQVSMHKLLEWCLLMWVSVKQYLQGLWEPGHW